MATKPPKPRKPQTGAELSEEGRANLSWLKKKGFSVKGAIEQGLALLKAELSGRGL